LTSARVFQFLLWYTSSLNRSFILLYDMLFKSVLFAAPLPLFAYGANIRRQLNDSTPETLTSAASSAVDTPPPTVSFSLLSTNPTAFPLSDIVESPSTHPTIALEWTFTAGEEPTDIVSATAPPLPSGKSDFFWNFFGVGMLFAPWLFLARTAFRPRERLDAEAENGFARSPPL
jgi:hypothetical protein